MRNTHKFLLVGAMALIYSVTGNAAEFTAPISKPTAEISDKQIGSAILKEVDSIVKKQLQKKYLTEEAHINLSLTKESPTIHPIEKTFDENLTGNSFKREEGQCVVNLNFGIDGRAPFLGQDLELKVLSDLKNEEQKTIMRQFMALHEHYHCEFSNIKHPINFDYNPDKTNHAMIGLKKISMLDSDSNYTDVVNENFAYVSAFMSLIKEYGSDSKNLIYVAESILAQRKEYYIQSTAGVHFTHFGLEKLLEKDTLEQVESINNPKDFKKLALKIANESAAKVFFNKSEMSQQTFTEEHFLLSVSFEISRLLLIEKSSEYKLNLEDSLSTENKNNLVSISANKILNSASKEDLADFDVFAVSKKILNKHKDKIIDEINQFNEVITHAKEYVSKTGMEKTLSEDNPVQANNKEQTLNQIAKLRASFVERTKTLSSKPF